MPEQLQLPGMPRARVHLIDQSELTPWLKLTNNPIPCSGYWDFKFWGKDAIIDRIHIELIDGGAAFLPTKDGIVFEACWDTAYWRGLAKDPNPPVPSRRVTLNPT